MPAFTPWIAWSMLAGLLFLSAGVFTLLRRPLSPTDVLAAMAAGIGAGLIITGGVITLAYAVT